MQAAGRLEWLRGWAGFVRDRWDTLRSSYWFLPALMTASAGLAALGLIELDRRQAGWLDALPWLTDVTPPGARSVLSTIAGSMVTVTGVVFSITVVALTLTSSQFGPRLLRTFLRDRGSQVVFGVFLATFVFNLLVLRAVEDAGRVPVLATAVSVLLALVSLFALIYFIHHMTSSLQASSVIAAVTWEIEEHIPVLLPEEIGRAPEEAPGPAPTGPSGDTEAIAIRAAQEGYVRVVDGQTLFDLACERDACFRVRVQPGDFVAEGEVLAWGLLGDRLDDEDRSRVRDCFVLGDQRTAVQDLTFLTDQLAEMAVRALSPGVNDPRTAVECVQRLGGVMARLSRRAMPSGRRVDEGGRLRVEAEPTRFAAIAASCFDPIRRYGAGHPDVVAAAFEALAAGAANGALPARRQVLEEHAHELHRAFADAGNASKRDRDLVEARFDRTLRALRAGTPDEPPRG